MKKLNRELRNTEEVNTESKQANSKEIGMDVIYRTLPNLKDDHQNIISVNYKLSDLHYWMNHEEEFKEYLQSLLDGANTNIRAINALIELYNGVTIESRDKKCSLVEGISKMYDVLPDESKQKICEDLLSRKKFFEDACVKIMEGFNEAVEIKNVGRDNTVV